MMQDCKINIFTQIAYRKDTATNYVKLLYIYICVQITQISIIWYLSEYDKHVS